MSEKRSLSSTESHQVIQPLRDLARNFDIDIEPYLQEYLYYEGLHDTHHDLESSSTPEATQFAAAALKIQNSTSIYTRKVDFLHQVVYEAHESLHELYSKNSKQNKRKNKCEDVEIADFCSYDDQMEFLLLDDVLPVDREGRKINLPTYQRTENPDTTLNETHNNNNVTLLSLGGIMSTTRDDSHQISRSFLSNTSPTAMSRMLHQNLNNDTLWRLVGSDVDTNGALVMPGAKKEVFVNGELKSGEKVMIDEEMGGEVEIFRESSDGMDGEFGGCNDDFGDDNDGGGFVFNEEEEEENAQEIEVEPAPEIEPVEVKEKKPEKKQDPWEALDPHEPSNDKSNPLKIGVTFRLPPGLEEDERPSACVTGSRTRSAKIRKPKEEERREVNRWHISPFATDWLDEKNDDDSMEDTTNKSHLDRMFRVKEMIYGEEFAYLAKRYAKHFDAIARQKRRQQRQDEGNDPVDAQEADSEDYDDYGGGFDYGGDDDHSYGNDNDAMDNVENDRANRSNVDFAAIDDVFATTGFHDDGDNDIDYNNSQLTFEELCRAHLLKFAASAEKYRAETQLTKRVGAWQTGLAPILEEQEKRPEFDIHSVGRQILQSVEDKLSTKKRTAVGGKKLDPPSVGDNKSNIIAFRQISKDKEEYEVCRLFLSTLMLCNCGNVIVHDGNDVGSTDSLEIELINSKFEAVMEEFIVPSMLGDKNKMASQLNMSQEDDDNSLGVE
jgi:condensin-2 complex subunit H2